MREGRRELRGRAPGEQRRHALPRGRAPPRAPAARAATRVVQVERDDGARLAVGFEHGKPCGARDGLRGGSGPVAVVDDGEPRGPAAEADHPVGAARAGDPLEARRLRVGEDGADDARALPCVGRVDMKEVEVAAHGGGRSMPVAGPLA